MKKIRKIISLFICACLLCAMLMLASCSSSEKQESAEGLNIVCTVFPQYDWVKQILGEKFEQSQVTLLLDNGVDLHNYQPTADDIIKISKCDIFIYVGGESDKWTDDVIFSAQNENMTCINMMQTLGDSVKEEELQEGMQSEEEHGHEEETEYDEHIWLSLKNAQKLCEYIAKAIAQKDSDNAQLYNANAEKYINELKNLDAQYAEAVENADCRSLVFADRFPFRYLTDDYAIEYYAAFSGCSAETEASFETVSFLAKKVDELGLNCVVTIDGSDNKIAQTVIENTKNKNQKIVSLDSLQSTTSKDIAGGKTYLSAMQKNLDALKEALA